MNPGPVRALTPEEVAAIPDSVARVVAIDRGEHWAWINAAGRQQTRDKATLVNLPAVVNEVIWPRPGVAQSGYIDRFGTPRAHERWIVLLPPDTTTTTGRNNP